MTEPMKDGATLRDYHLLSAATANTETLAGTKTLVDTDAEIQFLDPGGAGRTVTLPAEGDNNHPFVIYNAADAMEDLTVQNDAASTVAIVTQGNVVSFVSDGTNWKGVALGALYSGIISPASIGASQNDYAPTGFSTAGMVRLTSSAAYDITGLAGGSAGRIVSVHNIGAFNITLKDSSVSSSAANRFALTNDLVLAPDMVVLLQYDGTTSRWRVIGGSAAMTTAEADLGAFVALTLADNWYDGPSVALTAGTWLVIGTVTVYNTAGVSKIAAKLWDGSTVEASSEESVSAAYYCASMTLSGIFAPTGAITAKVSCASSTTNSRILEVNPAEAAGNTASTIRAVKIG